VGRVLRADRQRDERGVAFPSPVAILSIVAVAMAGLTLFATRHTPPTEREVTPTASNQHHQVRTQEPQRVAKTPKKPIKPAVQRGKVMVEVFNNSGITGLAGRYADKATAAGWKVTGSDNWYGTIAASTVYYPADLKAAAKLLALDLGLHRVVPAAGAMHRDRLTVILTADAP
jgi:hypothetical protein